MSDTPKTKATLLVVDDNPTNVKVLIDYLHASAFKVLVAQSGEQALRRIEYVQPDLILLDVMMPGLDGFETCHLLKENEAAKDIPVIFMTALSNAEDKVKGFSVGAVDYVTKPLQQTEVLARITTHLTIRRLQMALQEKNEQLEERNGQLQEALDNIKTLKGLIPICANCKNIRDDEGFWHQVEIYVRNHSDAEVSHSICPECFKTLYPEFYEEPT